MIKKQLLKFGLIVVAMTSFNCMNAQQAITGCVGECGSTSSNSFTSRGNPNGVTTYAVETPVDNLCDSHDAILEISFPNNPELNTISADLTDGSLAFEVPGQVQISIEFRLEQNNSGILCSRLGEIQYELRRDVGGN